MSTKIAYAEVYKDEATKRAAALKDFKEWCNKKQYKLLTEAAQSPQINWRQFAFYCGLAGIHGYPVTVVWEDLRKVHDSHVDLYLDDQTEKQWAKQAS